LSSTWSSACRCCWAPQSDFGKAIWSHSFTSEIFSSPESLENVDIFERRNQLSREHHCAFVRIQSWENE
jgi:hypothetical protein